MRISDLELLETLSRGHFGRVRLVRRHDSYFALKLVVKRHVVAKLEQLKREVRILQLTSHSFVVRFHGHFDDELCVYLLLEFLAGGELYSVASPHALFYSAEVLCAIEYLHSLDVVYRNLKPETVWLDADGHVKLFDFALAKVVPHRTCTPCGTPDYVAPEVLANLGYGKAVDCWALGVLVYEMLTGRPPFCEADPLGTYRRVLAGDFELPRQLDAKAKDLIKRLLCVDRQARLGCTNGVHDFLHTSRSLLGVADVKRHRWFRKVDWDALVARQCAPPFRPDVQGDRDTRRFDPYPGGDEDPDFGEVALDGRSQVRSRP